MNTWNKVSVFELVDIFVRLSIGLSYDQLVLEFLEYGISIISNFTFSVAKFALSTEFGIRIGKIFFSRQNLSKMKEEEEENSFEVVYAGWFLHLVCNIDEICVKISIFLSFI